MGNGDAGDSQAAAQDEVLAQLGHDLRNPLHTLMAALAVLEVFPPGSAEAEDARQVIARQAHRLSAIVDTLP